MEFIIGLVVGAFIGVAVMAILRVSAIADEEPRKEYYGERPSIPMTASEERMRGFADGGFVPKSDCELADELVAVQLTPPQYFFRGELITQAEYLRMINKANAND